MKRSHRVHTAVMLSMTLAACSADPLAPAAQSASPSLFVVGATSASIGVTATQAPSCGATTDDGDAVLHDNSTYIVAYGELLPGCATTPPADTTSTAPEAPAAPVAPPQADTLSFKLSF